MARPKSEIIRATATGEIVRGRSVAKLGRGLALVQVGRAARVAVRAEDKTTVLVKKAARALNKPGFDKEVVFRGPNPEKIFSYSVNPEDPTKVIRKASDGTRSIGRVIDGKFRPIKG